MVSVKQGAIKNHFWAFGATRLVIEIRFPGRSIGEHFKVIHKYLQLLYYALFYCMCVAILFQFERK